MPTDKAENIYRIALTQTPQVGVVTAKNLIAHFGSAKAIFEASKKKLLQVVGVGPHTASFIIQKIALKQAEKEYAFIEKQNIQLLFYSEKNFPSRLKYHTDAPMLLYFKGKADLNKKKVIAIVGTRQPSAYGKIICEEFIDQIQSHDILIISGLAYGIDAIAHRRCVALNIANIAVLGHGLQVLYPAAHRNLARNIQQNGGLLTEYISEALPEREHFPMRNRIIAGLCDVLLVVETGKKGGSMISAQIANSYHKDVFAFPGRINDPKSEGCNLLIKTHQASLIQQAEDLLTLMRWTEKKPKIIQPTLFLELSDDEKLVLKMFTDHNNLHIDFLSSQIGLTGSQLSATLLQLEFKGLLKALPGNTYMRV